MREQAAMTEREEFEAEMDRLTPYWRKYGSDSDTTSKYHWWQAGRRSRQKQDKELCYQAERQHQNSDCKSACRICAYKIDEAP